MNKAQYNKIYQKGYWAGFIFATKKHLGGKCEECKEKEKLQIHHTTKIERQQRKWEDYFDLSKLKLLCEKHHTLEDLKIEQST